MQLFHRLQSHVRSSDLAESSYDYFLKLVIFKTAWLVVFTAYFIFTKQLSPAILSAVGVLIYLSFIFVFKPHYKLFVVLMHIFVIFYVWFIVRLLGWCSGVQYFLLAHIALSFFNPFDRRIVMDLLNIIELSLFLHLSIFHLQGFQEITPLMHSYMPLLHVLSIAASCSIIIYAIKMTGIANTILSQQMLQRKSTLTRLANQDGLTGLHNRRSMEKIIDDNWSQYLKTQSPFHLITCDIDFLKKVNDSKGHDIGDILIKTFANILSKSFEGKAAVSRWSGDEFVIVAGSSVPTTELMALIENAKEEIAKVDCSIFELECPLSLTIGVASSSGKSSIAQLMATADECLYKGKAQGRNKVIVEE